MGFMGAVGVTGVVASFHVWPVPWTNWHLCPQEAPDVVQEYGS